MCITLFTSVQLYTPPSLMCNKDFLRQIISGEKELLPLSSIKMVNGPECDELSVTNLWKHAKNDPAFMRHFPDKLPKGRNVDREYMLNVLNTYQPEYVKLLIDHAISQRHSS